MRKLFVQACAGAVALLCLPAIGDSATQGAPLFDKLGGYHRQISTDQPMAQRFFDQGMVMFYGFEWNEAIRSFREAARIDPRCASCHWGLALSLAHKVGPLDGSEYAQAKAAIERAAALKGQARPVEQDLIAALAPRYRRAAPMPMQADNGPGCHPSDDDDKAARREKAAYVQAMKKLLARHAQDPDVKVLYAGAVFWGKPAPDPGPRDPDIRAATAVLREVIAKQPAHAGAHHYLIHLVEAYPHRATALGSADALKALVPISEHLVHMPSHIYFLLGRYHEATESNAQALVAIRQYEQDSRAQGFEPEINFLNFHDQDFLRISAAMEGRSQLATRTAQDILAAPFPAWLEQHAPLQWYMPISNFERLRFGAWDQVLATAMPDPKYAYAAGMWHYAQGIALVQTGDASEASIHARSLQEIVSGGERESVLRKEGLTLLRIAHAVLTAKLADSDGDGTRVIASLQQAGRLQDGMAYHEPPDWYFPLNQALGDAYLKHGKPQQAVQMYRKALENHPDNGWSLFGLAQGLRAAGQTAAADAMEGRFRAAWRHADIAAPVGLFAP